MLVHLLPSRPGRGKGIVKELPRHEGKTRTGRRAHAALVFDGQEAVGWCQFGPTAELPNIRSRKAYEEGLKELPDWRVTCFFVDREGRGDGIATVALREAIQMIAQLGGGTVEGYPEDYTGQKVSSSFLCSGTLRMFEKAGFRKSRKIAMHRWVVVRRIPRAAS
jgi:GNAT superfamily N-acetyltransferase